MITTLRGYAPHASSIRHAKSILSPSTSRRYRRFNCESSFFRRPYSTEHEHAAPLDNGSSAPNPVQSYETTFTVVRGGFGDEDENIQEDSRPARANQKRHAAGKTQFEGLQQFELANSGKPTSKKTSAEMEQQYLKEDSYASDPWLTTLGDEQGETTSPPENTFKRTTQEDVLSLCTYTPWRLNVKFGYLQRGFEFGDFRSARSFIIEAMHLNDGLKAHLSLSNFGRFVYTKIGSSNAKGSLWSLSDEDVDLGWALQKAAKKYLGRWQTDAAAQPLGDLGFASSWALASKFIVPVSERWHHLLDLRRPPMSWLTMEYRQISQLGITPSEAVEALVNQIAEDLVNKKRGEQEMAFPVWCITDRTLAVSQTEFFSTSASITKPGDGPLTLRETVVLHRNFNLEQFNAMVTKENASLKNMEDAHKVGLLLKSVTSNWNRATPEMNFGPMNTSAQDVYLKEWGPIMTEELQPLVRRILAKEIKKHSDHLQALPDIYSKKAVLSALEGQSIAEKKDWLKAHPVDNDSSNSERAATRKKKKMRYIALQQEREHRLQLRQASKQNMWIPKGFGNLLHMLREKLDEDSKYQDLGGNPDEMKFRPHVARAVLTKVPENTLWRNQYLGLRDFLEVVQKERQSQQPEQSNQADSSLNTDLVGLLSRVGFRDEPMDWRARYYELRRSAHSLGLLSPMHSVSDALDFARRKERARGKQEAAKKNSRKLGLHWDSDAGFSRTGQGISIKHHEIIGKYTWGQAHQEDASSQLDEKEYSDVLEGYTANKRGRPKATVFYHWLPGEKLNINSPSAVEANVMQSWRPECWRKTAAKLIAKSSRGASPKGNVVPLTHSPRPEPDASPLVAHRDPNDSYVRPLVSQTLYVHWLPGDSFRRDKFGYIIPPPRAEDANRLLEAKRQRLMDRELLEAQQKTDGQSWQKPVAQEGQHANTEPEPEQRPSSESLLSVEGEAGNGGHLDTMGAEKLLAQLGIDMQESEGGETTATTDGYGDGKKEAGGG